MRTDFPVLDIPVAMTYIGQTVLLEMVWDTATEPYWWCAHIVGIVLPVEGVTTQPYFMAVRVGSTVRYPEEAYLCDIRTIRAIRHRDRLSSGNVLDRMTRPSASRSGAALPAHRDGSFVAMNGSTGAAHP